MLESVWQQEDLMPELWCDSSLIGINVHISNRPISLMS